MAVTVGTTHEGNKTGDKEGLCWRCLWALRERNMEYTRGMLKLAACHTEEKWLASAAKDVPPDGAVARPTQFYNARLHDGG